MAHIVVPESMPLESLSQRQEYAFEPTQLSQPQFSQTQNTQFANSQVEPRRKYWCVLIPINQEHKILKISWGKPALQIGRGPSSHTKNDIVLREKRVSNVHCRLTLGLQGENGSGNSQDNMMAWKEGDAEPEVWLEDLGSSNGTFVNGKRMTSRALLQHGDEISLGHPSTLENHDARYIFRSVGSKGAKFGGSGRLDKVGEVYVRYQFLETLGAGTFAEVKRAVDVETGDMRAIKQIVKHRFANNPKTLQLFEREVDICLSLHHENICRLIEYFEDPQHICLVLEYVDGGDLLDHIMNYQNSSAVGAGLPEDYAAYLTLQICRAMAYTHSMGVTHRDLKPENILLTKESGGIQPIVKIADFGLAKMVHEGTMLVSMVGTPQYLAPEVVMQDTHKPGYENVVDSWSVGIIVYSMMTKALPFDEDQALTVDKRIKARYHMSPDMGVLRDSGASEIAVHFVGRLLERDPAQRMTMAEALEHEWLAGPSSQHSESQQRALGGDSMWEIESFDDDTHPRINGFVDDDGDANDGDYYRRNNSDWSRPMTASGTNLESGFEPGSSLSPSESFSQPMENLHLQTPKSKSNGNGMGQYREHGGSGNGNGVGVEPAIPSRLRYRADQSTPPSPPLAEREQPMDIEEHSISAQSPANHEDVVQNGNTGIGSEEAKISTPNGGTRADGLEVSVDHRPAPLALVNPDSEPPLPTPADSQPEADAGVKRKIPAEVLDAFSSGSLSPAPDSQPKVVKISPPARTTRSMRVLPPTPTTPAAPAPQDGGRTTRPRKSMRLG